MPENPERALIEHTGGHLRVLGPPGSGKTALLVERYRHLVSTGRRPAVIAFGREQRDALLGAVLPPGAGRLGPLPVFTHGHLASVILSAAEPSRPRLLRDVDELVVIDRVLARLGRPLESDLRSIAKSDAFRRALRDAFHVLAQNRVAGDDAARAKSPDPRARDVLRAYAAYREALEGERLATFYDAAWRAAEVLARDPAAHPLAGADVLLVDDFQDLDAGQFALIEALAPPGGDVEVDVFGDPTGPRFSFRGTSDRFLLEEFPRCYQPADFPLAPPRVSDAAQAATFEALVAATSRAPAPAAPVELPLFAATRAGATLAGPPRETTVEAVVAEDDVAEVQHAAERVRSLIRDEGYAPSEVAVIARDPRRYRSAAFLAFRERGIALDAGATDTAAIDDFVRALFGALGGDGDRPFVETLSSSPFYPALLDHLANGSNGARPRDPDEVVSRLRRAYAGNGGGADVERLLGECILPLAGPGGVGAAARVTTTIDEWRRYTEVAGHAGGSTSVDQFRRTYLGENAGAAAVTPLVALRSAYEVAGRSVRAAVILGCAEGVFPGLDESEGYLPLSALARALEGAHPGAARDLATRADRDEGERREYALLLTALTRATGRLFVMAPARAGTESLSPSRVLEPLFAVAGDKVVRDPGPASRAASVVAVTDKSDDTASRLRDMDAVAARWIAPPGVERRPRIESFSTSASGLETFSDCERKFFYRKILKVREPDSIHLAVGNLFHELMKVVVPVGASGEEVRQSLASPETKRLIDELVEAKMQDRGEWVRDLTRVHLAAAVESAIDLEELREGVYHVGAVESGVEFARGDARITGRLDRVDAVDGLGAVVIDYKMSKLILKTAEKMGERIEEKREYWQVPIYAAALKDAQLDVVSFLYYAVPPGGQAFIVGLQTAPGRRPRPFRAASNREKRYAEIAPATLAGAVDYAFEVLESVRAGECRFERTENLGECARCHFRHVCRRTGA